MLNKGKIISTVLIVLFISVFPVSALQGTVVSVLGKVELQTDNGWKPLNSGDTVDSGLIISTGFRSQAIIQVAGSTITVRQLTRLTLEQLTETDTSHNSSLYLDLGSIKADVKKAEDKRVGFTVNTPVATASVRGTVFEMQPASIEVENGSVGFMPRKPNASDDSSTAKETYVEAGNSSTVSEGDFKASSPQSNLLKKSISSNFSQDDDDDQPIVISPSSSSLDAASGNITSTEKSEATVIITISN